MDRQRYALPLALLLGVIVQASAVPAQADTVGSANAESAPAPDQQARAFFDIGAQAYEQGRYVEAIEAFENAYKRAPRVGLLFSIAQAHRRAFLASGDAGQLSAAVEHYQAYLASSSELPRRRDAQLALQRLLRLERRAAGADVYENASEGSRLMVSTLTPGAAVQVDGGPLITVLPHVATVAPGAHEVTLSAAGYAKQTRRILVPSGASYALDVDLDPLPGMLSLGGLAGSEVWLDGRLVAGLPVSRLPVSAGAHQLVVRKPGRRSFERLIRVAPEQDTSIDVELRNTRQRDASFVVLAASGAGVVGTGVLALLAYRQQGIARDWAQTIEGRPLLDSELADYDRAHRRRDQFRAAAVGTGVASAALAVVGALLMVLDTPPLPAASARDEETHDAETDLDVGALPGFDSSIPGLVLRGHL